MIARGLLAASAVLLITSACSETGPGGPEAARTTPPPARVTETPDGGRSARPRERTPPELPILVNEALGSRDHYRVRRSVRDLKRIGYWDDLTDHLAVVRVSTRPGAERIPADGHLADALYTAKIRGAVRGRVCDILVFSEALRADVERQEDYYAEGRLGSPAPTVRQFWSVIVAHELAHCSKRGQRGEAHSTRWERKVLAAFGTDRLGS